VRMLAADAADVVVMPATPDVAPLHRAMEETDYVFCLPASLTGSPAVVVPVDVGGTLPAAIQIVARPGREDLALRAARPLASPPTTRGAPLTPPTGGCYTHPGVCAYGRAWVRLCFANSDSSLTRASASNSV
jgi:hypothetical protein